MEIVNQGQEGVRHAGIVATGRRTGSSRPPSWVRRQMRHHRLQGGIVSPQSAAPSSSPPPPMVPGGIGVIIMDGMIIMCSGVSVVYMYVQIEPLAHKYAKRQALPTREIQREPTRGREGGIPSWHSQKKKKNQGQALMDPLNK